MTLSISYELPGTEPSGAEMYVKSFEKGDEGRPPSRPSSSTNAMGTKTSLLAEFGDSDVTVTIRQVPGPDRINPYHVIIRDPFRQDISGTRDGTRFEIKWVAAGVAPGTTPPTGAATRLFPPALNVEAEPVMDSVTLSPTELMLVPHDPRLVYDVEHDAESGSGDWVRFQVKGPLGVVQLFRIQTLGDPNGALGTAGLAESEVRVISAPYLPNSLERRCEVQVLKRPSGDVYYCLLTNAAFVDNPEPPEEKFRNLFLGVFRVGESVAFVVGNFSQRDDPNFRMMMETLRKVVTLPIATDPGAARPRQENGGTP
jgi:hypothetical protein